MLKTKNIFIDTQAFVSNNFFQSENLNRLAKYGKSGTVKIFITDITISEIKNNIKEDLLNAIDEINRFKKNITSKAKILKNFESYKHYLDLPKIDFNLSFEKIEDDLENFIKDGNVRSIPIEHANLNDIVNRYCAHKPPFNEGKKKYEFPDAIVLSAIDNWCKVENDKIYVISEDPDFKKYESTQILLIPNIKIILDLIIKQYERDEIEWIECVFNVNVDKIREIIKDAFILKLEDEIGYDIEISNIQIEEIILYDASLVENIKLLDYIFQLDYDITFKANVTYNDYSSSVYDKEDDKYYFVEKNTIEISYSSTQTAEISIEAYYEDGNNAKETDAIINCINTSIPEEYDITNEIDGYMDVF